MNLRTLFPRASKAFLKANEADPDPQLPHPKPQQNKTPALDRSIPRETHSLGRTTVRFTGYRVRPLDPDNFAASCKDLLDGLRHAQLIPGDEPWTITFHTTQTKVKSFTDERTVIEIENSENEL